MPITTASAACSAGSPSASPRAAIVEVTRSSPGSAGWKGCPDASEIADPPERSGVSSHYSPRMTPDLRRSPLHSRHVALGAKFAAFGGWEMPLEYADGGVIREHTAVRTAVGVFDVSHLGKASVAGPDAAGFVNACLSNDLNRIGPGQA